MEYPAHDGPCHPEAHQGQLDKIKEWWSIETTEEWSNGILKSWSIGVKEQ
jgi:hypothetical protein